MNPWRLPLVLVSSLLLCTMLAGCGHDLSQDDWPRRTRSQAWLDTVMADARTGIERVAGVPFAQPVNGVLIPDGSFDSLVNSLYAQNRIDDGTPAWDLDERTLVSLGMVDELGQWGRARQAFDNGSVLGFYLPATKTLYVFENSDTRELVHTIVHEMVHALQDQRFDLDAVSAMAHEADEDKAITAIIEGEAEYVTLAVEMGNPSAQAIEDSLARLRMPLDTLAYYLDRWGTPQGIPLSMTLPDYMPYIQGPDMISRLRLHGGWGGVDSLFAFPAKTTREVLWATAPVPLGDWNPGGCPAVSGSWRPLQTGRLGAVRLAALLYGSLPAGSDFERVLGGWKGDRFWSFESDAGRAGLLWRLRFETADQARSFAASFSRSRKTRRQSAGLSLVVDSLEGHVATDSSGEDAAIVRVSTAEVAIAEGFRRAEGEALVASLFGLPERSAVAGREHSASSKFGTWIPPRPPVPVTPPRVFGR